MKHLFEGRFCTKEILSEKFATVAQLVEQLICNQLVGGSSPSGGSIQSEK
jgi:hypothetical protein